MNKELYLFNPFQIKSKSAKELQIIYETINKIKQICIIEGE